MPMHDEKETMNAEAGSFRDKKMGGKRTTFKKKVCKFCAQKIEPDYKNPDRNLCKASESSHSGD